MSHFFVDIFQLLIIIYKKLLKEVSMKRLTLYFSCLLLVGAVFMADYQTAEASGPRMDGMSLMGNYRWMIQKDTTYIGYNPAYAAHFGSMIWAAWAIGNAGTNEGSAAILAYPINDLAVYFQTGGGVSGQLNSDTGNGMFNIEVRDAANVVQYNPANLQTGMTVDVTNVARGHSIDNEQIKVDAALKLDSSTYVGASAGYSTTQDKDEMSHTSEADYNRTQWYLGFGLFTDLGSGIDVDASVKFTSLGINNRYKNLAGNGKATYQEDGGLYGLGLIDGLLGTGDTTLRARVNYATSETNKIHFYLKLKRWDYSTKSESSSVASAYRGADDYERKGLDATIGISEEMKVNKNGMVFFGAQFERDSSEYNYSGESMGIPNSIAKYEYKGTTMYIPIVIGAEGKLTENWTGRIGAHHPIWNSEKGSMKNNPVIKTNTEDINDVDDETIVSIGASYKLEKFKFEWVVQKELLTQGPYLIGGHLNTGMASSFIALYYF